MKSLKPIRFDLQDRIDCGLILAGHGEVLDSERRKTLRRRGILTRRAGEWRLTHEGRMWLLAEYQLQDISYRMAREGYRTEFHAEYLEMPKWNERGVFRLGWVLKSGG